MLQHTCTPLGKKAPNNRGKVFSIPMVDGQHVGPVYAGRELGMPVKALEWDASAAA